MKCFIETNPLLNLNGRYHVEFLNEETGEWCLNATTDDYREAKQLQTFIDDEYGNETRIRDARPKAPVN